MKTRHLLLGLFALAVGLESRAQSDLMGRVLEKVACTKEATQFYALYVPSSYTPKTAWPVIFCFDPGARGLEPVKRLQAAAEKYGYIVAGSLNSRNGPWEANSAAIDAMVRDVDSHLHLDPKRLYTAGLSGGARVATQMALMGLSKGVIACSAGFPVSDGGLPGRIPFVFFGTAGTEDFNHREMVRLDRELDDRGATHRLVVFEGGHEWASVARLTEAVEWLELQAMRAGTRPRDEAMIRTALATRVAAMPTQPLGEVWRANQEIAADFAGIAEVSALEARAKELGASKELKAWRKVQRDFANREDALATGLTEVVGSPRATVQKQVAAIRQLADEPNDSAERQMARRVLAGATMWVRENVRGELDHGDRDTAAGMLELAIAIRPEQSRNYFDLARARALGGDKKRALEALQQAAEKGFSDAARTESEGAFAKLKGDAAFQAVLEKIRVNPPEPPGRGRGP